MLWSGIETKHGRNSSPEDTVSMGFMESDPVSLRAATAVFKQKRPSLDYVVLFMVRKPLSTILSGYNYRSAGKEKEQWTDKRLSWTHPRFQRPLRECFRSLWDPEEFVIGRDTTMFKEYGRGYAHHYADEED